MKNLEFTIFLWKGKSDPKGIHDCGSKQSFTLNAKKETAHPTEKPVALARHYISNSSKPDDVILDPMMGSGSAMVGAVELGRRAIGIEKNPKWFDVAVQRVTAAVVASQAGAQ